MGTVIQSQPRHHDDRSPRWDRTRRAALFEQYRELQAQGLSLRQAATALDRPRSTLQAWRASQESLDAHPAVVAFFPSAPGLAFLHRLVLGISLVWTEVGGPVACAWGVCWCNSPALIALSRPPLGRSIRSTVRWRRPSWRTGGRKARVWPKLCPPKPSPEPRMQR
jgi:hypothetical protein